MSENKTRPTSASVSEFLAGVTHETRRRDAEVLLRMMKKITRKQPKMWGPSMVGFDTMHYKYASGREGDMFRIGFSPRAQSLSLYLTRGFDNCQNLLKQLGKHKTSKACLYINKLDDVDIKVLEQLCREAYAHSLEGNDIC